MGVVFQKSAEPDKFGARDLLIKILLINYSFKKVLFRYFIFQATPKREVNLFHRDWSGRVSAGRLIAVFPTKKAGKIGATSTTDTWKRRGNQELVAVCSVKSKNAQCISSKNFLILKMQVSDLGSPVSPQILLAEHRQSSPEIDKLIQKAGEFNI